MSIDMTAPKYFTRASLPFHTRRKIFGTHVHRHDRAKIFYARIIALQYETNIFLLIWMCDHARVKYLGAVLSMSVSFGTPQLIHNGLKRREFKNKLPLGDIHPE